MASNNQENHSDSMANFTGIVLTLTFVIIITIVSIGSSPPTIVEGSEDVVEVVEVATDIPLPTETPIPPTATPMPTDAPTIEPTAVPTDVPTTEPTDIPTIEPTATEVVQMESAGESSSASSYDPSVVEHGKGLFILCGACHGVDGTGITGLGKSLVDSEFVHGLSDAELIDFIKVGRPVWDPENTTGVDMPALGGNPTLTDDDLVAVVAYIRSLSE